MRQQFHGVVERGFVDGALQLAHSGDRAAHEFAGDVRARQAPLRMVDEVADARLVVVAGRDLLRNAVAEDLLQLGIARESEVLGKAHHRRRLHAAARRDVLDLLEPQVPAVLLDVARDQLELAAQVVELGADALEQRFDRRGGVGGPRRLGRLRRSLLVLPSRGRTRHRTASACPLCSERVIARPMRVASVASPRSSGSGRAPRQQSTNACISRSNAAPKRSKKSPTAW